MTDKKNIPFFVFTLAVFVGLLLPSLVQDGMFMDGILYTVASKNFAHGIGTWWNPVISTHHLSQFHEQPPLMFWMLSFFFRVFGDSIYTERIYSFLTACFSAWLIIQTWKLIYKNNPQEKNMGWLPVLFWIIPPVCFWTFANTMEECTMSIFILSATWFIIKGLFFAKNVTAYLITGGVLIFLSSLCKGIQGVFPLATAGIYWLVFRKISFLKMSQYSFTLIAVPTVIYLLLFMDKEIADSIISNFNARIVHTFNAPSSATTENRFYILYRLFNELLLPLIICAILLVVFRKKSFGFLKIKSQKKMALFFLLIGLSGSLPLIATLEQRRFYLVPSLPFFAIALASLIAPGVSILIEQIDLKSRFFKILRAASFILLITTFVITYLKIGKTRRDKELLHDIYAMGKIIPAGSALNIYPEMFSHWSLQLYFNRHFTISLDPDTSHKHSFLLIEKAIPPPNKSQYTEVKPDLIKYRLFKLNN